MKERLLTLVLAGLVVSFSFVSSAFATNRFVINNQTLYLNSTANKVPILADLDQDTYAFSISLQYESTKINMNPVELGTESAALSPEYAEGSISPNPGRVTYGVVFDTSKPITKKLSQGTGREVLVLNMDVVAAAASTTVLDLVNVPGNPAQLNVMTNANGESVAPAPALVDGTLTLSAPTPPVIQTFVNNVGCKGDEFTVFGQNFNKPGFHVNVCGVAATAQLLDDTRAVVTAPDCGTVNAWAVVEVCTDQGCDSEANGFQYLECGKQFIRGDCNGDGQVTGQVTDAVFLLNYNFLGMGAPPCSAACDVNGDGSWTGQVTDAVYILNYNFMGMTPPPAPFPGCGISTLASDEALGCETATTNCPP